MTNQTEILAELMNENIYRIASSVYGVIGDVLIRVSNHLPKAYNVPERYENKKHLFIFTSDSGLKENEIESYLGEEFADFVYEYALLDEEDEDLSYTKMKLRTI